MKWKPVDIMMMVIVATICSMILGIIYNGVFRGVVLSEGKAKYMDHLVSAMIAIISLYVGSKLAKPKQ